MKILVVIGTRPEAIKMAPLISTLRKTNAISTEVCLTAQQREMVDQTLAVFGIVADYDLNLMTKNQSLSSVTSKAIAKMETTIRCSKPDLVLVQGDTTTAFCGALAAFYSGVKVGHIEAGLRTGNRYSPYPEEVNRAMIGRIADYHFAPTRCSAQNLVDEGIDRKDVVVSGNTVVDSLLQMREINRATRYNPASLQVYTFSERKTILVTGHRRENMGRPVEEICTAIKHLALSRNDIQFVYPVHLNPNIQAPVNSILSTVENVHLIPPLNYRDFVWLLDKANLVLTDSGGIQEEAPSFGIPVLVMRDTTERPEGIESGNAMLVGHDKTMITIAVNELLDNNDTYKGMAEKANPYGDGNAAERIVNYLMKLNSVELESINTLVTQTS